MDLTNLQTIKGFNLPRRSANEVRFLICEDFGTTEMIEGPKAFERFKRGRKENRSPLRRLRVNLWQAKEKTASPQGLASFTTPLSFSFLLS